MNELEMLAQVNKESLQTYGSLSGDYTTIPIPELSQTREQILSEYKAGLHSSSTTSTPTFSGVTSEAVPINPEEVNFSLPETKPQQTVEEAQIESMNIRLDEKSNKETDFMTNTPSMSNVTEVAVSAEEKEVYSHGMEWQPVPIGSVPTGYQAGKICGNCAHFCCGICYAFDFPCHPFYVCDGHEYPEESTVDLAETGDEVEHYAEGRTAGGNVTAEARADNATLSGGRFPIFDKRSAQSALKLRGKTKTKKERNKVIAKASKYTPKAAKEAEEKDKKKKHKLSNLTPSDMRLWDIAMKKSNDNRDLGVELYCQLYAELFGAEVEPFIESVDLSQDKEEGEEQRLSAELSATVSEPQMVDAGYIGPSEDSSKRSSTLYAIAETRIKSKYRKAGKGLNEITSSPKYLEEVQKEYERLVIARSQ